mmetsp:Transcript_150671/g.280944  ORF Transcript_150671/g.280944 Transcript_150671/m.280944 type:complete len:315 (-) Transcript_150671:33-977(-)
MVLMTERMTVANILPPAFICIVVGTIWSIYVGLHLSPMLQLRGSLSLRDRELYQKGVEQMIISQVLTAMFVICYTRSILGHPGAVPEEPEWLTGQRDCKGHHEPSETEGLTTREVKTSGERRFCKWCQRYKPDRTHHCRICKQCVLRMDHHCPWIMNCVGFRNHKFFFLLVVYAVLNCGYITFTIAESVHRTVVEETPPTNRFLLVLGMMLSIIMGILMTGFLSFHTWLMFQGMTTIEFCEKTLSGSSFNGSSKGVSYDQGIWKNMQAVLGPQPYLWLLPMSPPTGDGLYFSSSAAIRKLKAEPEWTGERASTP